MARTRLRRPASSGAAALRRFQEKAGLDGGELTALAADVDGLPAAGWCAGAVVLAGRGPYIALEHATGWALRYGSYDPEAADGEGRGVELPREKWLPMGADTVFDLASITKVFTAVAAVQQIERGTLELDAPVTRYAEDGVPAPDHGITVRHLLAHTSGLRAELPLYEYNTAEHAELLWREPPLTDPGESYRYSDLNPLLLQRILERVTERPLDVLVRDGITRPLGMDRTRFCPPRGWRARIAATEDQRKPWAKLNRGLVHGRVHDENAYAMAGVAGHAGLFSTAYDLAVLCRALLSGGAYGQARILSPSSVALLLEPPGLGLPAGDRARWFTGSLSGRAAGHTGFTGTSLVLDPVTDTFLVLLANTVHPVRTPADNTPRLTAAAHLAEAVLA
ncbi:serine hydrolase domain-containing protein [Streptomyces sp. NPDC048172]|uniref:serine hydrolase domain-containing protein n=1 Tax=Streptomyces sp. NPDC048172 TaxID=3365505 RepID=UPI003724BC45